MGPPGMEQGVPLPYTPTRSLVAARTFANPGPKTSISATAATRAAPPALSQNKQVVGLEMEDAVAHYDTLDGRTVVEPSNEVYLYSPRFGAVRQVVGLVSNEERQRVAGVDLPQKLGTPTTVANGGAAPNKTCSRATRLPPVRRWRCGANRAGRALYGSRSAGLPRRLQAVRESGHYPPRHRDGSRDARPRPRLNSGHRLVAHPGGADHPGAAGCDGRSEVRSGHVDVHGLVAAGLSEAAAGQGGFDALRPTRRRRSTSRSASTTSATSRWAT